MRKLVINHKITSRDSSSFKKYLNEVSQYDILSPEEEAACAAKAENGDLEAMEELIHKNLRFVVSVAKQYTTSTTTLEDLINEGNIGLIIAAQRYKTSTGFKFITYAVWWIRKSITEFLEKNGKLVRLPANKIYGVAKLNKKIDSLEQQLGRDADITEIIEAFCSEVDKSSKGKLEMEIRSLETINERNFDSLDREISSNCDGTATLGDMIADTTVDRTDFSLLSNSVRHDINQYLSKLKPKHKRVIVASFGLDGNAPLSLKEIADEMDITREMVRQIKVKSLKQLKDIMKQSVFSLD
jgi:RNA polymerase primary sigma factor